LKDLDVIVKEKKKIDNVVKLIKKDADD